MLGTALLRDNQVERAQKTIDPILRNGDSAPARLLLATAKLSALDFNGAIVDLEMALNLDPKLPDAHRYLGEGSHGDWRFRGRAERLP